MIQPVNTRSYDLFKAIIALLLLILLIWLYFRSAPSSRSIAAVPTSTLTPTSAELLNPSIEPAAAFTQVQPSGTPTVKPAEIILSTPERTTTLSNEQPPSQSTQALPQSTDGVSATETPAASSGQLLVDCPLAVRTRLKVGDTVRVLSNLNMRSEAGILSTLILTNLPGTQLTIIGGPVCEPYREWAYLWWQVRRADGQTGWSAEGSLRGDSYLLELVE